MEAHGFLQLSHPSPLLLSLAGKLFAASRHFFEDESAGEKERCRRVPPANSGWVGQGVEKLDAKGSDDLKECGCLYTTLASGRAFNIKVFTEEPKQPMPSLLAGETELIADFIAACHSLCMGLLEGMALSLSLPKDYFTSRHAPQDPAGTALRLLYYPPTTTGSAPLVRAGAHSDYGSLTLLFQQEGASASGLQVLLPSSSSADGKGGEGMQQGGEWLDVPAAPDRVLVNIGDLMEAWTAGRWPSTVHRVLVPPHTSTGARLSIAYFLHPADDVRLHRIGGVAAHGEGGAAGGGSGRGRVFEEGMTSAEWLKERFRATYI
ncbi:Clavaminate synthase-like protein [Calocera cornea HHB12733]|uniref:Clavaminate synthase-like protein n=1 Tax=Calocera cornea HHB12733 TaxID=1353952 RepID=A0A165K710_9BASI|nr:Clavaminate synthase-like protein [Calocera cornea HHB12733]